MDDAMTTITDADLIHLAETATTLDEMRVVLRSAFALIFPEPKREDEPEWQGPGTLREPLYHVWYERRDTFSSLIRVNTPEAHVAAALMLVPEGATWAVTSRNSATMRHIRVGPLDWSYANFPAGALIAAILRAGEMG